MKLFNTANSLEQVMSTTKTRLQPVLRTIAIALSAVLFAGQVLAQTKAPVLATVNGAALSDGLLELLVSTNISQGAKDSPALRQMIKDELIGREVLAQEAQRLGLDKQPQAQLQMTLLRQNHLVELLLRDRLAKNPISDEALRADYDRQIKSLGDVSQYRISHIVLSSEADAREVLARAKKGEPFDKLAREKSIDASKSEGGSLGWLLPNQVMAAISNVMVNLDQGAVAAAPIQTPAGWHVLKVDEKRPFKAPSLEQSKDQIRQGLQQQQNTEFARKLREAAKIVP
jgi:peptidyl-prolyl cis-trans isomerase C